MNSKSYKNLLEIGLLPDCRRLYSNGDWVFQQDGAPAHTSKTTQEYLDGATPDFIRKDEWPLQSSDCNPMDYAVWDSLSQKVHAGKQEKFTENEIKQTDSKVLERHYPRRNTKDNISLEKALANSGG